MLYVCTNPDCKDENEPRKKFASAAGFGHPNVCPYCGVESVEKYNLFDRRVAWDH